MGQRRTSLKEIAEQLGVSIATVSRAIRDSHEVGDEMKDKVKALAKKLKLHPIFKNYEIILAAGDGKLDDDDENEKAYNCFNFYLFCYRSA